MEEDVPAAAVVLGGAGAPLWCVLACLGGQQSGEEGRQVAVIAEFEANLIRQRTREGMAIARQNGKLRGRQPRLKPAQDREIRRMDDSGDYNVAEIAALFSVSRPTVYRSLDRTVELPPLPAGTWPVPDVTRYGQLLTRNPGQR